LRPQIERVFAENFEVYGARKVWWQMLGEGFDVSRRTVERLMQNMCLAGVIRGNPVRTTMRDTAAPCLLDHVNRIFHAPAPNRPWLSDFTYVSTWLGFVYVAFVIDAYARRIVGWRVSRTGHAKSTTLRAITGFISLDDARISAGEVTFDGRTVTNLPPHRMAAMGAVLVPQRDKESPNLTVQESPSVAAHRDHAGDELIYGFFPRLAGLRGKLAGLLSGGERQMLAIGATLACRPRLLLSDELSLGLAPVIVEEIAARLAAIRDELGLTIRLVEQNAYTALSLADRAHVLENGRVALEGAATALRADVAVQGLYLGGQAQGRRSYRDIGLEGFER